MRLSRREKDVADPSGLNRGGGALEGAEGGAVLGGKSKPEKLASATAPIYLHLFHHFCFLHPFFLFPYFGLFFL